MADRYDFDVRNPAALVALLSGDLKSFFVAGTPGGIEAQEAEGQRDLVNSMQLPIKMSNRYPRDGEFWSEEWVRTWNLLKSWGVSFGHYDSDADPLFIKAVLPPGWKKIPTDHNMWSILLDERGRQRAQIFYKAAFYDRKAYMQLSTRLMIERDYDNEDETGSVIWRVVADKKGTSSNKTGYKSCLPLFESRPFTFGIDLPAEEMMRSKNEAVGAARDEVEKWLEKHFPNWQDPGAYWDDLNVERAALEGGGIFKEVEREVESYRKAHDDSLPTKLYLPEQMFSLVMMVFGPKLSLHILADIPPYRALEEMPPNDELIVRICTMRVEQGDRVQVGM